MLSRFFFKKVRNESLAIPAPIIQNKQTPKSWSTVSIKSYERSPTIILPKILELGPLQSAFFSRSSFRLFDSTTSLSLSELSTILYYSSGIKDTPRRHIESSHDVIDKTRRFYPSGGARYPLETYVVVNNVQEINPGIYHYNILFHSLEKIFDELSVRDFKENGLRYEWAKNASVIFVISTVWDRNYIKYKDFGYDMSSVEAGHMTQNLLLVCSSLKIGCCPLFGFNNNVVDAILDFDENTESVLYMTTLGR